MKRLKEKTERLGFPKHQHMKLRWKVDTDHPEGCVRIVTDESDPWHICLMDMGLPGDDNGEAAAKAIVEQHNAALKVKAAKKKG